MNLNSPIFDRIRSKPSPQASDVQHPRCDHPGCREAGLHRAPKGRMREGQYFCFCLDHVRAYNQSYNYFTGMSDEDVVRFQRDAETGHRPTWTMGVNKAAHDRSAGVDFGFRSPQGDEGPRFRDPRREEAARPRCSAAALKCLEALGLDESADAEAIKSRYKELVKRLHPDANGGDRSSEDRLREIIHAYKHLRAAKLA
jgi:curved DNA-binding protein CbpA